MHSRKEQRGRKRHNQKRDRDAVGSNSSVSDVEEATDFGVETEEADSTTNVWAVFHQWSFDEEAGHVKIVHHILSFLDVTVLVEKKQVCKKWKQLSPQAIDNKCPTPKNFETNKELCDVVYEYCTRRPGYIEKIATVYGYPINKWKVQDLEDFSKVFFSNGDFNEDISSWDVSNAKTMKYMFGYATSFNQPLPWNTRNVTDMSCLFYLANSFNQPLPWNTRNVTNMEAVFYNAKSFNQSLESWDTSNVTNIAYMFYGANSFNQPLDTWDTSKIVNMEGAFGCARSFNQSLTNWTFHDDVDTWRMLCDATSYDRELPDALIPNIVGFYPKGYFKTKAGLYSLTRIGFFSCGCYVCKGARLYSTFDITVKVDRARWATHRSSSLDVSGMP